MRFFSKKVKFDFRFIKCAGKCVRQSKDIWVDGYLNVSPGENLDGHGSKGHFISVIIPRCDFAGEISKTSSITSSDVLLIVLLCFPGTENAAEGAPAAATGEFLLIYNPPAHETGRRCYFHALEPSSSIKARFKIVAFTRVSVRKSVRRVGLTSAPSNPHPSRCLSGGLAQDLTFMVDSASVRMHC